MTARTTYLERYLDGEYEPVWDELVALGAAGREEPVYTAALAVAHETMRRVRHNIEVLIPRLRDFGYEFGYGWAVERAAFSPREAQDIEQQMPLLSPPSGEVGPVIDELERRFGTLPLSLRVFYEIVGGVNLVGSHPTWSADGLDALVVESAEQLIQLDNWGHWSDDKDAQGTCILPIAPDEHQKYFISGSIYTIHTPTVAVDTLLEGEWHHTNFVDYLRICFRWGGFPKWERVPRTAEVISALSVLTGDLLPL